MNRDLTGFPYLLQLSSLPPCTGKQAGGDSAILEVRGGALFTAHREGYGGVGMFSWKICKYSMT